MRSVNRFSDVDAQLSAFGQTQSWQVSNAIFNAQGLSTFRPGKYRQAAMLRINPDLPTSVYIAGVDGDMDDLNEQMTFVFAVRMQLGGSIEVTVSETVYNNIYSETITIESSTTTSATSINLGSATETFNWTVVRLKPFLISGNGTVAPSYNFLINFDPAGTNETFYFTSPTMMRYYELLDKNSVMVSLGTKLPDWILKKELSVESNPNVKMLRFMDIASDYIDKANEYLSKFLYADISDGYNENVDDTKSTLVDPTVADYQTLLWLLVFTFTYPIARYRLSPDYEPTPFILDESELDGTDRIILTASEELLPPAISRETQIALLRWQARTSYYGGFAGTLPAVRESAKQMLTGNKTITISYNYETTPWVINIFTPWNETLGGDVSLIGSSSTIVMEAISYAKPLGVLVNHQMTAAV
jgi:hypothetical protein